MNHGQMEINPSFCMIFKQHNQRKPGFLDQYVIWCHNLMKLTYADLLMARELIQSEKNTLTFYIDHTVLAGTSAIFQICYQLRHNASNFNINT